MDNIYIFKYHITWEAETKGTGEGFVFAADFDTAYGELKKMYGPYIAKIDMEKVGEPDCYVFETKADGKEVKDRWYC